MKFNHSKCELKIFTLRQIKNPNPITFENTTLPWVPKAKPIKYLGVLLDTRLSWKAHIVHKLNKAQASLFKLYPILNKSSHTKIDTALHIYKTALRPMLTYACPVWGGAAASSLKALQVFQNKFLRMAIKSPWFVANEQIHREFDMATIKEHIAKVSNSFFLTLPTLPATKTYLLGKSYNTQRRIQSRFPKDKLRPP